MLASAYTAAQIRQWLLDHNLITSNGSVIDARAIYDAAHLYGVLGRELDAAVGYPSGTADAWAAGQHLPPLDGVDRSGYVAPTPAPAPSPAPAPVSHAPAPAPAVQIPVVQVTPAPAPTPIPTPAGTYPPLTVVDIQPVPAPAVMPGEVPIDAGVFPPGTLDPGIFGSTGGAVSKPLLYGVAALAALFMLRKKG